MAIRKLNGFTFCAMRVVIAAPVVFAHLQCGWIDCDVIDVNSAPDESAKESSYFHVHGSHL